ncbi:MAG: fibronectin type III domain-containing protein [Eubacteriales bacterium]|nr:fibronectin type III domain-containing protein [Eubacteriales bacterium]
MKRIFWQLAMVCMLLFLPLAADAASFGTISEFDEEVTMSGGSYSGSYAVSRSRLYYYKNTNGSLGAVSYDSSGPSLKVLTFSEDGNLTGVQKISLPMSLFGGYYHGTDGNHYVAVGEYNTSESTTAIVCKILKYSPSWSLLGTADIPGGVSNGFQGIYEIFECSQARMTLYGKYLICHTGRTMFVHADGLHHQSDITFVVDTTNMKLLDSYSQPYCSHSFAQFVETDGINVYFLNHGDGYPRSIQLTAYPDYLGSNSSESWQLFSFLGETGENYTGTTVNSFLLGDSGALVTGLSVPHNNAVNGITGYKDVMKNIYLITVAPDGSSKFQWLTDYAAGDGVGIKEPKMVKISGDRFAILFQENWDGYRVLRYLTIDSAGNILAKRNYLGLNWQGNSDPLYSDGKILWISPNAEGGFQWEGIPYLETSVSGIETETEALYFSSDNGSAAIPPVAYDPDKAFRIQISANASDTFELTGNKVYFKGGASQTATLDISCGNDSVSIPCIGLTAKETMIMLRQGEKKVLDLAGSTGLSIQYTSENPLIAEVDSAGTITGVGTGATLIRAGIGTVSLKIRVSVYGETGKTVSSDGKILSANSRTVFDDKSVLTYVAQDSQLTLVYDYSKASWKEKYQPDGGFWIRAGYEKRVRETQDNYTLSGVLDFSEYGLEPGDYNVEFWCELADQAGWYLMCRSIPVRWKDGKISVYDQVSIGSSSISVTTPASQTYTGKALTPAVTVKLGTATLKKDRDYTLEYSKNTNAGTASITLTGMGSFTGSRTLKFQIKRRSLTASSVKISQPKAQTYTGKALKPSVTVTYGKTTLKKGTDYKVTYSNNTKVGLATVKITGRGNYQGTASVTFEIRKKGAPGMITSLSSYKSASNAAYLKWKSAANAERHVVYGRLYKKGSYAKISTTKTAKISVTSLKGAKLQPGTAYQFKVLAQRKTGGKWVSGKESVLTVVTTPKAPAAGNVSASQKALKISWKKVSGVSGYEIYVSQKKDSGYQKAATAKSSVSSATIKNLTSGKTYYVKVRSFKKAGGVIAYSAFSKVKTVKVK